MLNVGRYLLKRFMQAIFLLLGVSIISFTIMHTAPGSLADILSESPTATAEDVARIEAAYGLDKPIYVQYYRWLSHVVRGDFGLSHATGRPVMDMIVERLPATLAINIIGIILIYLIAIPTGIISAVRQYSWFDHIVTFMAFMWQAMPGFYFALLLIYYVDRKSTRLNSSHH